MPAKGREQVASWITPDLKKRAVKKVQTQSSNGVRVSMSTYIEHLIRKDLERKESAA